MVHEKKTRCDRTHLKGFLLGEREWERVRGKRSPVPLETGTEEERRREGEAERQAEKGGRVERERDGRWAGLF